MKKQLCFSIAVAALAAFGVGTYLSANDLSGMMLPATAAPVAAPGINSVNAHTDSDDDKGFAHCFQQSKKSNLFFDVTTDQSVLSINFVLVNIKGPDNPKVVESVMGQPVKNGAARITVSADLAKNIEHLGPGPYVATLAASTASAMAARSKTVDGTAAYSYETWKSDRSECHGAH